MISNWSIKFYCITNIYLTHTHFIPRLQSTITIVIVVSSISSCNHLTMLRSGFNWRKWRFVLVCIDNIWKKKLVTKRWEWVWVMLGFCDVKWHVNCPVCPIQIHSWLTIGHTPNLTAKPISSHYICLVVEGVYFWFALYWINLIIDELMSW